MSGPDLDPELTALEESLRALPPRTELARDAVLFEAGRASLRSSRFWPALSTVATAAALVLGWLLWRQPLPTPEVRTVVVERVVVVTAPTASETTPPPRADLAPDLVDALRRRQEVVKWGVDMLRDGPPQRAADETLTPAALPRLSEEKLPREF